MDGIIEITAEEAVIIMKAVQVWRDENAKKIRDTQDSIEKFNLTQDYNNRYFATETIMRKLRLIAGKGKVL